MHPLFRSIYIHLSPCYSSIFWARSQNVFGDSRWSHKENRGVITTNANFGKNKWQTPKTGHKMDGMAKTRLLAVSWVVKREGDCKGAKGHRTIYVWVCVEIFRANKSHTNKSKQTNQQANEQINKQWKRQTLPSKLATAGCFCWLPSMAKIIVTRSRSCIKNWPRTQAQTRRAFSDELMKMPL